MKKLLLSLLICLWCGVAGATSLNIPYQNEQPGGTIKSGDWNSNFQAIAQWANNNNIDGSTNIATSGVTTSSIANGAVTNAKIDSVAGIYTYGDVYGSALISLSGISSSAGEIPTANLGTGTANSSSFLRGDQTWQNTFGPTLSVLNTGTQGISANSWTLRTFGTVTVDSGSYWSSNTYTPKVAGYYLVTYTDNMIDSGGNVVGAIAIYKNSSLYSEVQFPVISSVNAEGGTTTAIVYCNGSTDTIEFYVHSTGSATTYQGTGYSFASIARVY